MEFLLRYWDELDDVAALCCHLSRTVITEIASLGVLLRAWGDSLSGWLRPERGGLIRAP